MDPLFNQTNFHSRALVVLKRIAGAKPISIIRSWNQTKEDLIRNWIFSSCDPSASQTAKCHNGGKGSSPNGPSFSFRDGAPTPFLQTKTFRFSKMFLPQFLKIYYFLTLPFPPQIEHSFLIKKESPVALPPKLSFTSMLIYPFPLQLAHSL